MMASVIARCRGWAWVYDSSLLVKKDFTDVCPLLVEESQPVKGVNFIFTSVYSAYLCQENLKIRQGVELQNFCNEKPKLRTFVQFKDFGTTPNYLTIPMSFLARKFLALLRLSNLSIRLETGRHERPRLDAVDRSCPVCINPINVLVEDEIHFLFYCNLYEKLRDDWLRLIVKPVDFLPPPGGLYVVMSVCRSVGWSVSNEF